MTEFAVPAKIERGPGGRPEYIADPPIDLPYGGKVRTRILVTDEHGYPTKAEFVVQPFEEGER
jgi:hypothetical protein